MTPMMAQYQKLKSQYPDAILFFRLGDFYEMFFEDAIEASQLLQIILTARNKGDHKAPMCGVPYHAANNYIAKLTRLGKKVAICEQLSDPNLPGIVKRDVVRIITPGTTLDENILDRNANNFILALTCSDKMLATSLNGGADAVTARAAADSAASAADSAAAVCMAYADITTGEFMTTTVKSFKELQAEFERIAPAEVIIPQIFFEHESIKRLKKLHEHIHFYSYKSEATDATHFLMDYLKSTQKTSLTHFQEARPYNIADFMPLDEATVKNLELLTTLRENKKEGSLLWVLDQTVTAMGGRLLRFFLTHPLTKKPDIEARLEAIEALTKEHRLLADLQELLKTILDLERLLAKLSLGHGNARDLIGLKNSLKVIPAIKDLLKKNRDVLLARIQTTIDELPELVELIDKAIISEPPLATGEGGMIADGYNNELDELKKISREGKQFIQNLQQEEIKKTGINTLKIRFNNVFGYYIEITKAQAKNVPEHYIRKQTLVNAERYITSELKELEARVLGAEEKIVALEQKIFQQIRAQVVAEVTRIQHTAKSIALLDVLSALAMAALKNHYCKPKINTSGRLVIKAGRHPVVEKMLSSSGFIPNDLDIDNEKQRLILLTGPNMGGKSTYLRQTALIVLMAQIGSFIPAEAGEIGIADRIFTRVGASDNLVRGQSTFMVEMQEAANILAQATEKSLIILDEIGRGTSTYDGMSIAWAIMEYLHDKIRARTLFATHYHELIALAEKLPNAANYSVTVKDDAHEGVVFLYKILSGGVDRSYGIEVAKLAGLPAEVISKAKQILVDLEEGVMEAGIQKELNDPSKQVSPHQIGLFHARDHSALKELAELNVNALTPLEAINKLASIKKNLS